MKKSPKKINVCSDYSKVIPLIAGEGSRVIPLTNESNVIPLTNDYSNVIPLTAGDNSNVIPLTVGTIRYHPPYIREYIFNKLNK